MNSHNFKDYKIKVNSESESKEVQRLLFKLGYRWPFSKTDFVWLSKPWLSTSVIGRIRWHEENQNDNFYRCELMTLQKLQKLVDEQEACQ